ncbi:MAG: lysine transporter LysE [Thermoprotei archaeon]|nr:MAG: lysine transporter LysE [Thermoprotei archaeon]
MVFGFALKVVLISCSGALAPGPLTTATAALGVKGGWRSGFKVALGHMAVELPLIVAVGLGFAALLESQVLINALSLVGGLFMLGFAALMIRDALRAREVKPSSIGTSPLMVGVGLSALNPLFLLWWATAGAPLIVEALELWGLVGLAVLYALHGWLDYVWLSFIAHLTWLGGLRAKVYGALLMALAIALIVFGLDFTLYGALGVRLLPS